jgi:hypothetical protein
MNDQILEAIKLIGGLAGLITFTWKIFEEYNSFIRIKIEVKKDNNNHSVLTEVENTNKIIRKHLNNAFIIVSPENSDILAVGQRIASKLDTSLTIEQTNQFESLNSNDIVYIDSEIMFIPLDFYFSENVAIGDEKMTYRCSIRSNSLNNGSYSARFFVYASGRLHRSTQDLFFIS